MASQKEPLDDDFPPSQSDPSSNPRERVWKLKDAKMEIGSCGKKNDKDPFMTLDLVFKFDDEQNTKVVGEFIFILYCTTSCST